VYSEEWKLAVPLSQHTAAIPPLVPAQGTIEGRLAWGHVEKCHCNDCWRTVDTGPEANPTSDSAQNNVPETPEKLPKSSGRSRLLKPDPLVPIVSQLFQQGFHVTLDKGSRIHHRCRLMPGYRD
jgi:hypothetical protein